jgi:hypothetical protein
MVACRDAAGSLSSIGLDEHAGALVNADVPEAALAALAHAIVAVSGALAVARHADLTPLVARLAHVEDRISSAWASSTHVLNLDGADGDAVLDAVARWEERRAFERRGGS